jgi:hypothetical protein
MDLAPHDRDSINDLRAEATQRAKAARAEAEEAARVQGIWDNLYRFVANDWSFHVLDLFQKESSLFKRMRAESHQSIPALDDLHQLAKDDVERTQRRFPSYLEQAFRAASLPLDADSRHPRYSLEHKFFQLEIDEQRRMAKLTDREGKLAEFPADIGAVLEVVQREHKRVFGRSFDGKKVLKLLRQQYVAIAKKEKLEDGASIPIRHITRRLGKNVKGFRSDEFLIDLSRLVEQGPMEIDGWKLDLQQTKDTNQGMLLHGAAGRGYVGFVVFRKV